MEPSGLIQWSFFSYFNPVFDQIKVDFQSLVCLGKGFGYIRIFRIKSHLL